MYNDSKRFQSHNQALFCDEPNPVGLPPEVAAVRSEMEKCFPYSILTKKHQLMQAVGGSGGAAAVPNVGKPSPPPAPVGASYLSAALLPLVATAGLREGTASGTVGAINPGAMSAAASTTTSSAFEPIADVNGFYGNAMVTDVGICFSMSNVNLNGHPPTIPLAACTDTPHGPTACPPAPHLRLSSPKRSALERRKSYEDPGPETALLNARRRAAAFVPVSANGRFNPGNVLGTAAQPAPSSVATHHRQQHPSFFPASMVYPLAHHPTAAGVPLPKQQTQLPSSHPVHQPLPRQRSLGMVGKSAYGLSRSTSSERVRGTGSPSSNPAGSSSALGTSGSLGMTRSSPPYFKQPPGSSKANAVNYYQPPTTVPSSVMSANSSPYGTAIGNHTLPANINQGHHVPTGGGYHHRGNVLKCLPLTHGRPLAGGSPTTAAGYEYYRYAIEAAESVGKLQSSQSVILPSNPIAVSIDEHPNGATGPMMDYNGLRQLFLKCCYNEMKLLPSATISNGATALPTDVSASTSAATSLSSNSPANPYEFDTEPTTTGVARSPYPPGHYPLTSRSCPSSPDGLHCHASPALPTTAPSARSTPIGEGRLSAKQDRIELASEEDDVRPMEVCSDDAEMDAARRDADVLDDEPKDFSMKAIGLSERSNSGGWPPPKDDKRVGSAKQFEDCSKKELKAAPKKKWIRHYMNDEPLSNGHSTAPPLVVIATNGTQHHPKHLTVNHVAVPISTSNASPMTIDLSTKGLSHPQQNTHYQQQHATSAHPSHGLSTTPPASSTLSSLSSSSSSSSSSSLSSSSSSSSSSTLTVSPIDDSQSSLNLSNGGASTNGYIVNHSANSNGLTNTTTTTAGIGGSSPLPPGLTSVLPINISSVLQTTAAVAAGSTLNGSSPVLGTAHHTTVQHLPLELQQQVAAGLSVAAINSQGATAALFANIPTGTRRRTTSSNSNGVGTREVHNKLEKNRRAHLKECFEQLKKQLSLQPDEKKISNLSILHAAIRHIQLQKRKEREFEHEMERLAKEKIAAQNRILVLKREITQMGDIDISRLAPDTDITPNPTNGSLVNPGTGSVQPERDQQSDIGVGSTVPGRNGIRYSSSSSLSSIATNASISSLPLQTTISPVLSVSSPTRASPALNRNSTSPSSSLSSSSPSSLASSSLSLSSAATNLLAPLSLTTKGTSSMEAHNGLASIAGQQPPASLKITAAPLNGLNLSSSSLAMVNGTSINGTNVTLNGTTTTTAPLPVIVGANGTTNIVGIAHSQLLATSTAGGGSPAIQTIPLNLNVTSSAVSNGLSGAGPTSIAITTANSVGGVSGALSLPSQALQLTSSANGINSSSSSIANTVVGTVARSVYNTTTIAPTLPTSATTTTVHVPAVGGKELINGTIGKNGTVRTDNSKHEIIATQSQPTNHSTAVNVTAALDPPGTKVITIMNGNTFALAPLDKDSKMGVVYSPILLPTSQGLRVIQQASIELAPPNGGNRLQLHLTH